MFLEVIALGIAQRNVISAKTCYQKDKWSPNAGHSDAFMERRF